MTVLPPFCPLFLLQIPSHNMLRCGHSYTLTFARTLGDKIKAVAIQACLSYDCPRSGYCYFYDGSSWLLRPIPQQHL
jgi:hypothetical protein